MIWRVCERFGILPPGVKNKWEDNNVWAQSQMFAYNQIRDYEEATQGVKL